MNQMTSKVPFLAVLLAPALLFVSAPFAHAQVYTYTTPVYSTPSSYPAASSSCIDLTAPMTIGASDYLNGGQVSELQTFLVRDGLLSSAYITGYYGQLTASAVAQFQSAHGISPVGVVGPETRSAIEQVSCGTTGIISPAQPVYPVNPLSPANPIYPINPGGPIQYGYGRPDLNSLSVNYSGSSAVITIQGADFTPTGNTVTFGSESITGVSSNGEELSFNVPSVAPGTYSIYVTNEYGSSNSLTYTVSNNNNCNTSIYNGSYSNNSQCNCVYPSTTVYNGSYSTTNQCGNCTPVVYNNDVSSNYNTNYNCSNNNSVTITSVNSSGSVGNLATIYGTGFTTNANTVYINGQAISNVVSSNNGTSLTFTVPELNYNYNNSQSYSLYVTNGNGISSNTIQFTVNNNGYTNGQLDISYLSPTAGNVGTQVTIQGSGFSQYGNTVYFGNGGMTNLSSYDNGSSISFTVPSSISPCSVNTSGICPEYAQLVTAGSYPIYVVNQNGATSNTVDFQVY